MIKANIINSVIDIDIDPVLSFDNSENKGAIKYGISISDNENRFCFNNVEFDIFGTEALVQLADALEVYIDKMELRDKIKQDDDD